VPAARNHSLYLLLARAFCAPSANSAKPNRFSNRSSKEIETMSKGMNQKREQKRKPAKTLEEKRAAKKAKKAERGTVRTL
jgi:hypothetical protein